MRDSCSQNDRGQTFSDLAGESFKLHIDKMKTRDDRIVMRYSELTSLSDIFRALPLIQEHVHVLEDNAPVFENMIYSLTQILSRECACS